MSADGTVDDPDQLAALYRNRFDTKELADKRVLWSTPCESMFQQYVPQSGTVLDLGAGNCEFSNAIHARRRVAVYLNPQTRQFADPGVEVLQTSSTDLSAQAEAASTRSSRRTSSSTCRPRRSSWRRCARATGS